MTDPMDDSKKSPKYEQKEPFPAQEWSITKGMIQEAYVYFRERLGPDSTIHWGTEKEGYCIVTVDTSRSTQPKHLRRDMLFIETAYRPYGFGYGPYLTRAFVHNGLAEPILVKTFYDLIGSIRFILGKS